MKFNKIFAALAAVALAGGFASCSDDKDEYTPASPAGNAEVYFDRDQATTVNLTNGQTEITLPVYRVVADEAMTVNISSVNPSGIFTVPPSVSFEAGSKETEFTVNLDWDQVEGSVDYILTLTIDQAQTSPYGLSQITLNASYAPWSEWEPLTKDGAEIGATYTTFLFNFAMYFPEVQVRHSLLDEINNSKNDEGEWEHLQYRMCNYIASDDNQAYIGFIMYDGPLLVSRNTKTNAVSISLTPIGYTHAELGDLYLYSPESLGSTFDPVTGLFMINCYYLNLEGYGYQGTDLLQLDGYVDYSVTMTEGGHYIDANGTDYQVIKASFSEDISSVKYVLVSGSPIADVILATAEKIDKGELDAQTLTAPGAMAFAIEEKGTYTVIAVAYDKNEKMVHTDTFTFNYRPFSAAEEDPNEGWTSLGYCRYTDDTFTYMFYEDPVPYVVYSVELQEKDDEPGLYRLVNPYGADYPLNEPGDYDPNTDHYLVVNATDPDGVYIENSPTSLMWDPSAGYLTVWSLADYAYAVGQGTRDQIKAAGMCGKLENGVITFPVRSLLIEWSNMPDAYYANLEGKWKLDMTNLTTAPEDPELASVAAVKSFKSNAKSVGYTGTRYYQGKSLKIGRGLLKAEPSYLPLH